jgi:hypothetical protein
LLHSKPSPVGKERIGAVLTRVDYAAYRAKVNDVANKFSMQRVKRALRSPGPCEPTSLPMQETNAPLHTQSRASRRARRNARKVRPLSTAGKARVDLQIRMLAAIPAEVREEFIKDLVDHAGKYPSSGRYLRNLADQGDSVAREIVAHMGGTDEWSR